MVNNDYRVNYSMLADFLTPPAYKNSKWLTIDMPIYPIADVVSKGTTVYSSGTRYPVTVTAGDKFTNTQKFAKFQFTFVSGTTFSIKDIKFYKSLEWSVHSVKELNDDFNVFNVVRIAGRIDSRRRANAS